MGFRLIHRSYSIIIHRRFQAEMQAMHQKHARCRADGQEASAIEHDSKTADGPVQELSAANEWKDCLFPGLKHHHAVDGHVEIAGHHGVGEQIGVLRRQGHLPGLAGVILQEDRPAPLRSHNALG